MCEASKIGREIEELAGFGNQISIGRRIPEEKGCVAEQRTLVNAPCGPKRS